VTLTRREMLLAGAAAVTAVPSLAADPKPGMGVVIHSYGIRNAAERQGNAASRLNDPLNFLEHCRKLGAGGVQLNIGVRDRDYLGKLRARLDATGMYLEGSVGLPADKSDIDRFASEVRTAKEAGVTVLRCAILSGRRYETFDSEAGFRQFAERSWQSLQLAEPVVAKHDIRLALENHKDWLIFELLDMLKKLGSKHVGVTVDTGNSIALLEGPMEVVEAYAPWAYSTHIKDMGVQEYEDGFLLSEVPLGTGFLDMKKIVAVLRQARPEVRFNLEMITRDPLKVPCLTGKFWATMAKVPGRKLAESLAMVRKHASKQPLPRVTGLSPEGKLDLEERHVRQCLEYARKELGL
jgi:sugar phosphate isomerase/epimerase